MNVRELQGNEPLKQQLSTMAEPPHECILSGPEGSGRHALAQILAQALVCQEPQAVHRPCGLCSSCQKVAQGIHPDVVPIQRFLSPESKEIKVDAARQLRQDASYAIRTSPAKRSGCSPQRRPVQGIHPGFAHE